MQSRFQSTFPRGERHEGYTGLSDVTVVSIHVPTRGTTASMVPATIKSAFQSTFPRGERLCCKRGISSQCKFQSTFPRGERHLCGLNLFCLCTSFNPRSHEGNDEDVRKQQIADHEFQSTFPRGERLGNSWLFSPIIWFQSTFPRGERRCNTA